MQNINDYVAGLLINNKPIKEWELALLNAIPTINRIKHNINTLEQTIKILETKIKELQNEQPTVD